MIGYGIVYVLLLFANAFENIIPGVNYWDEITTIILVLYFIIIKQGKIKVSNLNQWALLFVLVSIGILGNIIRPNIQNSDITILKDVFAITKFFVICFIAQNIATRKDKKEKTIRYLSTVSRLIIIITFAVAIFGYFVDIGVYTGEIRIVKCFKFIFSVPTFFVSSYVMLAAVLIADSIKKNRVFLLLDCGLLFLAQRIKGYVAIIVIILFIIAGEKRIYSFIEIVFKNKTISKSKSKMYLFMIIGALVAFFLGKSKIQEYLFYGIYAARPALYIVGLRIATDFFPLGSGFGTFASTLSTEHYSNIYRMYGIQNVLGLADGSANFSGDVFWPCIYGQFGVIGFFVYVKAFIGIIKNTFYRNIDSSCKAACMLMWIYALIASTSEAYFTNSSGIQFAIILFLLIGLRNENEYKSK